MRIMGVSSSMEATNIQCITWQLSSQRQALLLFHCPLEHLKVKASHTAPSTDGVSTQHFSTLWQRRCCICSSPHWCSVAMVAVGPFPTCFHGSWRARPMECPTTWLYWMILVCWGKSCVHCASTVHSPLFHTETSVWSSHVLHSTTWGNSRIWLAEVLCTCLMPLQPLLMLFVSYSAIFVNASFNRWWYFQFGHMSASSHQCQ